MEAEKLFIVSLVSCISYSHGSRGISFYYHGSIFVLVYTSNIFSFGFIFFSRVSRFLDSLLSIERYMKYSLSVCLFVPLSVIPEFSPKQLVVTNLWSILLIVLRRVRPSLTNWEQWRRKQFMDFTSRPQLHNQLIVSRKPCLNFCYLKVVLSTFQKNLLYLLQRKPFKNDEKCFIFHLKSSVHSQDI